MQCPASSSFIRLNECQGATFCCRTDSNNLPFPASSAYLRIFFLVNTCLITHGFFSGQHSQVLVSTHNFPILIACLGLKSESRLLELKRSMLRRQFQPTGILPGPTQKTSTHPQCVPSSLSNPSLFPLHSFRSLCWPSPMKKSELLRSAAHFNFLAPGARITRAQCPRSNSNSPYALPG